MAFDSPAASGIQKDTKQVEEGFRDLSNSLANLNEYLESLDSRLAPVLRMEPNAAVTSTVPECELVPLAAELRANRKKIDRFADRVHSWISRIEL